MGRLLGRTGWRLARQLPGARTLEREAQRLQTAAVSEARRLLQVPPAIPGAVVRVAATPEEQRAVDYIRTADPGTAPLRSAMSELLERSVEATRTDSRDYLFGTIISQLVPDEARILAALSDGAHFAAIDVVQKVRRGTTQTLLAHASAVGRQAGLVAPDNTPTYLTRLRGIRSGRVRPGGGLSCRSSTTSWPPTRPCRKPASGHAAARSSSSARRCCCRSSAPGSGGPPIRPGRPCRRPERDTDRVVGPAGPRPALVHRREHPARRGADRLRHQARRDQDDVRADPVRRHPALARLAGHRAPPRGPNGGNRGRHDDPRPHLGRRGRVATRSRPARRGARRTDAAGNRRDHPRDHGRVPARHLGRAARAGTVAGDHAGAGRDTDDGARRAHRHPARRQRGVRPARHGAHRPGHRQEAAERDLPQGRVARVPLHRTLRHLVRRRYRAAADDAVAGLPRAADHARLRPRGRLAHRLGGAETDLQSQAPDPRLRLDDPGPVPEAAQERSPPTTAR